MSTLTINLEIGHDAFIREKTTAEGFTHDWEVFVRGCNGADIRHYVERVVFHLHETFEKPKRVVKEPPYSLRTSGYAGFTLPIQIYLKNSQEPRKIQFNYDLHLQPNGPPIHKVQKEKYTFQSVNEDFRNKLLKGGAVVGIGSNSENLSINPAKFEEKNQMTSKPKLSGSEQPKKYKLKPEEPRSDQFTNLFGTPITKTSRVQELPKKESSKPVVKSSDKDKGDGKILDKDKVKTKSPNKDKDRDKEKDREKPKDKEKQAESNDRKSKDDKKEKRDKKERDHSKKDKKDRRDRDKDKEKEKDKEREKSSTPRAKSPSPKRSPKRPRSPSPVKSSTKEREAGKDKDKESRDKDRDKEKKAKKHKEKDSRHREKDRDRDRDKPSEHNKDYKNRDSKTNKEKERENSTSTSTTSSNGALSTSVKEKESDSSPVVNTHPQKPEKIEKEKKEIERVEESKPKEKEKEKSEDKPKHKHKKKDKDRKEKKEKEREDKSHKKDEKKQDKEKISISSMSKDVTSKERDKTDNLFGSSPKSEPASPTPIEVEPEKTVTPALIDDETSNGSKISSRESSPLPEVPPPAPPPRSPSPPPIEESPKKASTPEEKVLREVAGTPASKKKDKKERKKDKKADKDHEKKRKRKVEADTQVEIEEPSVKIVKKEEDTNNNSDDERKVSSTEDANLMRFSEDGDAYMSMLRELQIKINDLKENSHLQKVVDMISETGPYEITANSFDFDLCLLNPATVMRLRSFFSSLN